MIERSEYLLMNGRRVIEITHSIFLKEDTFIYIFGTC